MIKKDSYIKKPNCKTCKHYNVCNHGLKDCTKYTNWVTPCNQGCKHHNELPNGCFIERGIRLVHGKNILDCKKYEKI